MRYFGPPGDAPVYENAERAATPVGRACFACLVPVEEGERGFLIPDMTKLETDASGGATVIGEEPWHVDCFLHEILGPLARLAPE